MAWKGLVGAAALAALSYGSIVMASDAPQVASPSLFPSYNPMMLDEATTAPSAAPAAASGPTTLTPVMYLLDPTSFGQWMEKNHLSITGFFDSGYFYDTNNPHSGTNAPTFITFPGPYSNHYIVDQIDATISKALDTTKTWDWGFTFENGYGTDDAFIHSFGMLDWRPPNHPQNQYDIPQIYGQLLVPLGTGLQITAGKFVGFLGDEVIAPTGNAFYTHSYAFFYGVAGTDTGIYGTYTFAKLVNGNDLTIKAGSTRGWNQSRLDNNRAWDFLGAASTSFNDKWSGILNVQWGPEAANDNEDYWTTLEAIVIDKFSDELTFTGDFLYSDFPHGAITTAGASAQWYGAVGYAGYKFNSYVTANGRAEWYRDQGGFTTGNQANYYEATAGVQIHPFPDNNILQWLQIRPEIRYDWSDKPVYNLVHNGGAGAFSELTFAADILMQF